MFNAQNCDICGKDGSLFLAYIMMVLDGLFGCLVIGKIVLNLLYRRQASFKSG